VPNFPEEHFREHMAVVVAVLELLKKPLPSDRQQERFANMGLRSAQRLMDLVLRPDCEDQCARGRLA
jgi:hypothetical protein